MALRICWTGARTSCDWVCGGARRGVSGPSQVGQVGAFGLVELQRVGDRFEDLVGDTAEVSALQLGVVVDADSGEQGNLLSAEAGNAPVALP